MRPFSTAIPINVTLTKCIDWSRITGLECVQKVQIKNYGAAHRNDCRVGMKALVLRYRCLVGKLNHLLATKNKCS